MLCPSLQVYSDYSQAMQQPERGHLCFPPQTELKRTDPWLHACQLMKACNLASVSPPGRGSHQKLPHFQRFQTFIFPKQVAPRNQVSSNFRTKLTLPVAGECFPGEMQTANTRHALQKQHFDGVVLKASELAPIDKHGNPAVSWRASRTCSLQRRSLFLAAQITARQPVDGPAFDGLPRNSMRRELDVCWTDLLNPKPDNTAQLDVFWERGWGMKEDPPLKEQISTVIHFHPWG